MGNIEALFVIVIWVAISAMASVCITGDIKDDSWQTRLIEAELAEFVVDLTTGDTTFIIYAEQETN